MWRGMYGNPYGGGGYGGYGGVPYRGASQGGAYGGMYAGAGSGGGQQGELELKRALEQVNLADDLEDDLEAAKLALLVDPVQEFDALDRIEGEVLDPVDGSELFSISDSEFDESLVHDELEVGTRSVHGGRVASRARARFRAEVGLSAYERGREYDQVAYGDLGYGDAQVRQPRKVCLWSQFERPQRGASRSGGFGGMGDRFGGAMRRSARFGAGYVGGAFGKVGKGLDSMGTGIKGGFGRMKRR
ncbi:hypothetical protein Q7P37_002520 [Cladosporium fusiforme]